MAMNERKSSVLRVGLALLLAAAVTFLNLPLPVRAQQNPPSNQSFVGGRFVAKNYIYTGISIAAGTNIPSGSGTIVLSAGSVRLPDGRTIVPFSSGGFNILGQPGPFPAIPISVGSGTTQETVTPTGVSGCFIGAPQGSCKITATFANAHGTGEVVTSGSSGVQEAANDAAFWGGGTVVVDPSLNFYAGGAATVTANIAASKVVQNVAIEDTRTSPETYWSPLAGATTLAAPATLTAVTALPSTSPVGAFTATAYNMCIAYVDILGQEGPCSTSFVNTGAGATSSFVFSAPAASAGAVGYTIYIGLTGAGSTTLQYKVPLVTQPSTVGTYPVSNGVCAALTLVETTTPACAVANTNYNQTGSTATVTAITVNTSPIQPLSTVVSTTSVYVPNAGGRTTYTYSPGASGGAPGMPGEWLPFTISAADATTVPSVLGTINIPPQYMNVLGKTLRICGYATTTASTATIEEIQLQWDSIGQNTAGKGVLVGDGTAVATWATAGHLNFCQDLTTTTTAATATGGSIMNTNTWGGSSGLSSVTGGGMGGNITSTTSGLNLALDSRINVIYVHTTGTDGTALTLQSLTARLL